MGATIPEPNFDDPKELWAFFGLTFYAAQVLEQGLLNLLVAVRHAGGPISPQDANRLFADGDRKTFGTVFGEVKKYTSLCPSLETDLEKALSMRNDLAHEFFVRHDVDLLSESGRRRMVSELLNTLKFLKETDSRLDTLWQEEWRRLGVTDEARDHMLQEMRHEANERD